MKRCCGRRGKNFSACDLHPHLWRRYARIIWSQDGRKSVAEIGYSSNQNNLKESTFGVGARKQKDILSDGFMRRLHKRMFGTTWRWAGQFRTSDKNIGGTWWKIPTDLKNICDDVTIWIESGSYPPDEIAARFHHRLVAIHSFPNGNGRHARTITDLLLVQRLGRPRFTWGSGNPVDSGGCRRKYIDALRSADRYDYQPMMDFVRT
jgi:Fic-DOC domain mobile mystery protein B